MGCAAWHPPGIAQSHEGPIQRCAGSAKRDAKHLSRWLIWWRTNGGEHSTYYKVEHKSAILPLLELGNQAKTFSSYFLLRWAEKAGEREKLSYSRRICHKRGNQAMQGSVTGNTMEKLCKWEVGSGGPVMGPNSHGGNQVCRLRPRCVHVSIEDRTRTHNIAPIPAP